MELLSQMLPNKYKHFILVCWGLLFSPLLISQERSDESKIEFKGYLKNMSTLTEIAGKTWYENLTHNRLNLIWYANTNTTIYFEIRNRILLGDFVNDFPIYSELIDVNNDYFDLSANIIDNGSILFNTMIDRAYMQWNKNNWEVKLGRQRINWGINLAWNPNDWFNAYSFFDFDYEERRGSDAIRVNYYTGATSSLEVAAKMAENTDDFVAGAKWNINQWDYDIQFLGGMAHGDLAIGTGWAGNLGLAGFKGEITYLKPVKTTLVNAGYDYLFIGSLSSDYSFKSSLYLNASILFHSDNETDPLIGNSTLGLGTSGDFTMRQLSNYRWSSFIQSGYQFSPLVTGSLSVMAFPGSNALFVNPAVSVSLHQDFDLGIFGQLFFDENIFGDYQTLNKSAFLRLKWSF